MLSTELLASAGHSFTNLRINALISVNRLWEQLSLRLFDE